MLIPARLLDIWVSIKGSIHFNPETFHAKNHIVTSLLWLSSQSWEEQYSVEMNTRPSILVDSNDFWVNTVSPKFFKKSFFEKLVSQKASVTT